MLRLQDNEVIYNNSTNLGAVYDLDYVGEGFAISLPDNSTVFIPQEDCTAAEAEVFAAWQEAHTNDPAPQPQEPASLSEPADEEKVAMAEAIIDLNARLSALEGRLQNA